MITEIDQTFEQVLDMFCSPIYDLNGNNKLLNYYPSGVTTYYTPNLRENEIKIINEYMVSKKLEGWNTRIGKYEDPSPTYVIWIASAKTGYDPSYGESYKGLNIRVRYGDFSKELEDVIRHLEKAKKYVANKTQENMLDAYIRHFREGDIELHKESQRYWVKDKEPNVEVNLGFIENYRDPSGIRSEFEAFVAIVDKEMSKKFKMMVDKAPQFLDLLPWPKEFEKDNFNKPDFTSLEVLTFVTSGIPAGINIPNYDDVRATDGFKNVSLGNIIRSVYSSDDGPVEHLTENDQVIYRKHVISSFTVDVGGHELLGHGSGKLLYQNDNGTFNFDRDKTINPLTNKPISSWYKEGETYSSKFGFLGSGYEECRAECVGLFFSTNKDIHDIFDHGGDWEDIMYVSWLWMIRAGLISLPSYDPVKQRWMQAHSQARYVIYRVMSEIKGFVTIELANDNFVIKINRDMILSHGIPQLLDFLKKLQIFKSTGNYEAAAKMFNAYSEVDNYHLNIRRIVIEKKKPRHIFVQSTTYLDENNDAKLRVYESNIDGMIESICTNYPIII